MKPRLSLLLCALSLAPTLAFAQGGPPGARPAGPPPTAKSAQPVDLTGQWVSVVTEDWRWRMATPPKGDFDSLPLNPEGRRVAYAWDLAADNAAGNQCKAWGAGGISRMPARMRISWADDQTLKLETDSGQQTRTFKFVTPAPGQIVPALTAVYPPSGERTWQGDSRAQWFSYPQSQGLGFGARPGTSGALRVVTRNQKAGYIRKNGAPYSEDAVITEQFNRHDEPNGDIWITITTIVEDPRYLTVPFITSSSYKKEASPAKWNPQPCLTPAPLGKEVPPNAARQGF